jgi:predicted nucleotidyltransferase
MNYGLPDEAVEKIRGIFSLHPLVEKAIIYGSRAKGTYRNGSDIDVTIVGSRLDGAELARIENEMDELLLPYSLDLSIYAWIDNPDLVGHIERVGIALYSRG